MGDGSSAFGSGFSELVKDIGGKVGSVAKGSAKTLGSTVLTQVTGQTPKPKTVAGQPVQSSPIVPAEKALSGSSFDLGAIFTGEKDPQVTTQQSSQVSQVQQNAVVAEKNKTQDAAKIAQLLHELHKQVYYDPLVRKIEGKDKQPVKSVQEEHEDDDQKKEMAALEEQKKEERTKLPPTFREFGRNAKG